MARTKKTPVTKSTVKKPRKPRSKKVVSPLNTTPPAPAQDIDIVPPSWQPTDEQVVERPLIADETPSYSEPEYTCDIYPEQKPKRKGMAWIWIAVGMGILAFAVSYFGK